MSTANQAGKRTRLKVRPGKNALIASACVLAVGALGYVWPFVPLLVPVLVLVLICAAYLDFLDMKRRVPHISASRLLPACVGRDIPFDVRVCITNAGVHPAIITLRDGVPHGASPELAVYSVSLAGESSSTRTYQLRIPRRGYFAFGPAWIRLQGRMSLLDAHAMIPCASEGPQGVKVYPESVLHSQEFKNLQDMMRWMSGQAQSRHRGEGLEFESIAHYSQGDDPRHVDWRSSARTGALMVRKYQMEKRREVVILVDCGRLMGTRADGGKGKAAKLDRAVDSALMLSRAALLHGDRCGVGVFDSEVRGFLPSQTGPKAFGAIMESLYDVQPRFKESDFSAMFATLQSKQQKRALVVVLSDIVDQETSHRLRSALYALTKRHVVVFAALQTPLLRAYIREPVESSKDVARKAVVMRLLRERERALYYMTRAGINVLDVDPAKLTVPLINQYIDLRGRGVL